MDWAELNQKKAELAKRTSELELERQALVKAEAELNQNTADAAVKEIKKIISEVSDDLLEEIWLNLVESVDYSLNASTHQLYIEVHFYDGSTLDYSFQPHTKWEDGV